MFYVLRDCPIALKDENLLKTAIYAPYICSQAPRTDKNTPENSFRRLKNEGIFSSRRWRKHVIFW
jgi:hypothetical protein